MTEPLIRYDEPSDTLYVSFAPGESATGIELNDHILLRVDKRGGRAVGITFFDYSLLAQQTELGPRSFPLTGLEQLSPDLRALVINILQTEPVSEFLTVSAFTRESETIPIVFVRSETIARGLKTGDALRVLEELIGTVEGPPDWAAEHDHYIHGTPKRGEFNPREP